MITNMSTVPFVKLAALKDSLLFTALFQKALHQISYWTQHYTSQLLQLMKMYSGVVCSALTS